MYLVPQTWSKAHGWRGPSASEETISVVLLNAHVVPCLYNTSIYTHRLVLSSTLAREVSFYVRQQLMWRLINGKMAEIKWISSSPCMTSTVIPSNSGNTIAEDVKRKAEGGVGCCGMLFSGHDMTYELGEAVVACTN